MIWRAGPLLLVTATEDAASAAIDPLPFFRHWPALDAPEVA